MLTRWWVGGVSLSYSMEGSSPYLNRAVFLREDGTNALISSKFHSPTDTGRQERSPWPALLLRWFHAIQKKSRMLGPGKENRSKYNHYS